MANRDLEIGSKVKLSEDTRWTIGDFNPIGIYGTVLDVDSWVHVAWSNGFDNAYMCNDNDLIIEKVDA